MSDAIKELLEALGNAPITFDMHRNVTVCCGCGARCDQGWEACMPGSFLSDGRRLCDACAEAPPSWPSVMAREKREMALAFKTHFLHGELAARKALWLGHGHTHALYGDDGEMQCAACAPTWDYRDYKNMPLDAVVKAAIQNILKMFMDEHPDVVPVLEHINLRGERDALAASLTVMRTRLRKALHWESAPSDDELLKAVDEALEKK